MCEAVLNLHNWQDFHGFIPLPYFPPPTDLWCIHPLHRWIMLCPVYCCFKMIWLRKWHQRFEITVRKSGWESPLSFTRNLFNLSLLHPQRTSLHKRHNFQAPSPSHHHQERGSCCIQAYLWSIQHKSLTPSVFVVKLSQMMLRRLIQGHFKLHLVKSTFGLHIIYRLLCWMAREVCFFLSLSTAFCPWSKQHFPLVVLGGGFFTHSSSCCI